MFFCDVFGVKKVSAVKIVIAPDSFKESLSALKVAQAIERGFKRQLPHADYLLVPVADGGEGTVQAMLDASGGQLIDVTVMGPQTRPVRAHYGLIHKEGSDHSDACDCAIIEMASASGLHLVPAAQRDPTVACSYGTGELILDALNAGVRHIILGLGGSATNDAGSGMLRALGVKFYDAAGTELAGGGLALAHLARIDLSGLHPAIKACQIEVACDVDNPLCGDQGASAVFGPQKGATPEMIAGLDAALANYASKLTDAGCQDHRYTAGAGAAGGMGLSAMAVLNADLRPGVEIVSEALGLEAKLVDSDLVITGEGCIDAQTVHGKTPMGVARLAKRHNKPVIGFAGRLGEGAALVKAYGIDHIFAITPAGMPLEKALAMAAVNAETKAAEVAAWWLSDRE